MNKQICPTCGHLRETFQSKEGTGGFVPPMPNQDGGKLAREDKLKFKKGDRVRHSGLGIEQFPKMVGVHGTIHHKPMRDMSVSVVFDGYNSITYLDPAYLEIVRAEEENRP